jgi:hypothetical protein
MRVDTDCHARLGTTKLARFSDGAREEVIDAGCDTRLARLSSDLQRD